MSIIRNWRSHLQGQAASYWLNAQADALLAKEVLDLLHQPNPASTQVDRLSDFLAKARTQTQADAFLACCAFTLWEINGRMDYEVARIYARLSDYTNHLPPQLYTKHSPSPLPWLSSWFLPLIRSQHGLRKFLEKNNCDVGKIKHTTFIHAIKVVQELNIAHNQKTIAALEKMESNSSSKLKALSLTSPNPAMFMQAAIKTQHAAIFWDTLFIKILNVLE